jgi:hypothetical protein
MRRGSNRWFIIGIVSLVILGFGSYIWATVIISSAESYRSPLATHPPIPGDPVGQPLTRRVVIVLIDALRIDTSNESTVMPFLNELRAQAASATMHSQMPSISAPGWATLLTGGWPDINDSQPFDPPQQSAARPFTQDNIFLDANRAGLRTAVSGHIWLKQMLANSVVTSSYYTSEGDQNADREVVNAALPWLSDDYQLVLIHLDQVDYAGHYQGGPISPNWNAAAMRADDLLREIVSKLDLTSDTVLIVSDHGQIDQGGHGGPEPITLVEPFVLAGASVIPGQYGDVNMVDVAPTLAVLLGTNIPAINQGHVLTKMLILPPQEEITIQAALKAQQSRLLSAYTAAINSSASVGEGNIVDATQAAMKQARDGRLANERVWRNMGAAMVAILPAYYLIVRKKKGARWLAAGALVYISFFNLRYGLIDGRTYSLSSIKSLNDIIIYIFVTAAISLILGWLVATLGLKAHRGGPRKVMEGTLGYIWMTVYFLSLPSLLSFAINGFTITWTLPDFNTMFISLLSIIQWIFVAVLGLVLTGLSALIGILNVKIGK